MTDNIVSSLKTIEKRFLQRSDFGTAINLRACDT